MATQHQITVSPDYPAARRIIEDITYEGKPADATMVYEGPRNKLFYVDGPSESDSSANSAPTPLRINVKAFRVPPFPNDYIYATVRAGKAARSYRFARRLIEMGIHTPVPIGYSEIRKGIHISKRKGLWPRLTKSYYFCEQIPYPDMRCWESRPDHNALAEALGAEIARLHAAGVWMKDFSTGNILVQPPADSPDGRYHFHYVDLNRTAFGITDHRKLMEMFKALSCFRDITLEIATSYAKATGRAPEQVINEAGAVFDRFQKRMQRKKRFKQCVKKVLH